MKYAIVFSSKTGNTAMLAERIKAALPGADCVYCGSPNKKAREAELIYLGFWTDKGSCDGETADFLESLRDKRVFLFGTAGFGGDEEYFTRILSRVRAHLDTSVTVTGSFMCQGKMQMSVRQRYETMLPKDPKKMQGLIDNFDSALSHPDAGDLERLEQAVQNCAAK